MIKEKALLNVCNALPVIIVLQVVLSLLFVQRQCTVLLA